MLFHGLHTHLERDDVILADRFYCSYWEIALLRGQGIDIVMRLHQRRQVDFQYGWRLGREDHRELRMRVPQRGFRTRVILVATTLLDAQVSPKEGLAGLYWARWHAELDLRSIKQTLQMDVLRCKTPAMVRKELWGHLLVYNLLRVAMAQAALGHRMVPRQVSL